MCLFFLSACAGGIEVERAETEIARFHDAFNRGNYRQIWSETAPDMKQATSEKAFTGLLMEVTEKLGPHVSGSRTGWRINYGTGASTQVVMESKFAKGVATETFVLTGTNEQPRIAGYHVNSDAMFQR